jgi:hypothetical protein
VKFSAIGALRLRPFYSKEDENLDPSSLEFLGFLNQLDGILEFLVLTFVVIGNNELSTKFTMVAIGVTALISGMEWNRGAKSRALNSLFEACVLCGLLIFLG